MCADCLYAITSSNWATEKSFPQGASHVTQPANIPAKELAFTLCSKGTQVLQKVIHQLRGKCAKQCDYTQHSYWNPRESATSSSKIIDTFSSRFAEVIPQFLQ